MVLLILLQLLLTIGNGKGLLKLLKKEKLVLCERMLLLEQEELLSPLRLDGGDLI
jgi:hypothetical protein